MPRNIRICDIGTKILEFFLVTSTALVISAVWFGPISHTWNFLANPVGWLAAGIAIFLIEFVLFWIGIILVYTSSVQLGVKKRIIGALCGWIPFVNLFMLTGIIRTCRQEVAVERNLAKRDRERAEQQVCKTKYPLLLVHGVFFRDFDHFNYWGRIPAELEKNGATIYYGEHNSAASVNDSALELEKRIKEIVEQTGCGKVNIIAHSKGGLDSRTAIATTSARQYVASLTTINTPHRGCEFADYLLGEIPQKQQEMIAKQYNTVAAKLGDKNPDFLAAVYDLTSEKCRERNEIIHDDPDIYYQSVGSVMNEASSGQFPLNFTYRLVKYFDGENDGLVGIDSFNWGSSLQMVRLEKKGRGISHGDMIDLNRENLKGLDIREFYVQLVSDLRERGF
ncbi:MAG: triacylglycerol lipase [Lachnospiraceae bacterium]|nr:triacylglycerol lipase [Lachnospiraceae bacterium]